MVDRERILAKFDELDGYIRDLHTIAPQSFEDYRQIEKKRACERLLQITILCVIDVCNVLASGLRCVRAWIVTLVEQAADIFIDRLDQKLRRKDP